MNKISTSFRALKKHAAQFKLQAFPVPVVDEAGEGTEATPLDNVVYIEFYEGGDPRHGDLVFSLRGEQSDLEVDEVELDIDFPTLQYGEGSLAEHFVSSLAPSVL